MYYANNPRSSVHRTMTNAEARRRQQTMRNNQKTARATRYLQNRNNLEDPAYPVNINSWVLEAGNANVKSKAAAVRANYNIFNRSRHAALWKNEFSKAGSKTRKYRRHRRHRGGMNEDKKAANEVLRELTSTSSFRKGNAQQRYRVLKDFLKAKKAGLATTPEYSALLQLMLLKYGISPDINMSDLK